MNAGASVSHFFATNSSHVRHVFSSSTSATLRISNSQVMDMLGGRAVVSSKKSKLFGVGVAYRTTFQNAQDVSAVAFANSRGELQARRFQVEDIDMFTVRTISVWAMLVLIACLDILPQAIFFGNAESHLEVSRSCVGVGAAQAAVYVSEESSVESSENYVDSSYRSLVCSTAGQMLVKENPGSGCFQTNRTDCSFECQQFFDASTCMVSVTDGPSSTPSFAPSASLVPSQNPSSAPVLPGSEMPSTSPVASQILLTVPPTPPRLPGNDESTMPSSVVVPSPEAPAPLIPDSTTTPTANPGADVTPIDLPTPNPTNAIPSMTTSPSAAPAPTIASVPILIPPAVVSVPTPNPPTGSVTRAPTMLSPISLIIPTTSNIQIPPTGPILVIPVPDLSTPPPQPNGSQPQSSPPPQLGHTSSPASPDPNGPGPQVSQVPIPTQHTMPMSTPQTSPVSIPPGYATNSPILHQNGPGPQGSHVPMPTEYATPLSTPQASPVSIPPGYTPPVPVPPGATMQPIVIRDSPQTMPPGQNQITPVPTTLIVAAPSAVESPLPGPPMTGPISKSPSSPTTVDDATPSPVVPNSARDQPSPPTVATPTTSSMPIASRDDSNDDVCTCGKGSKKMKKGKGKGGKGKSGCGCSSSKKKGKSSKGKTSSSKRKGEEHYYHIVWLPNTHQVNHAIHGLTDHH